MADDQRASVLFVFYSFTQQTRRVADSMGDALRARGHDVTEVALEFTDPHYGRKFEARPMSWPIAKIVSMLPAQLRRKTGQIQIPPEAQQGGYDLVVIGAPTWWLTTCMPMRSYLRDPAARRVLEGKPFAAYSTSRRYYKNNLKTIRKAGEASGGRFVDATHFVADGNQVMSMWSWLAFMRHDEERERSLGVRLPRPNLRADYEQQAVDFINGVADQVLQPVADAG
jgi:menaquinone-dependent protoporphyrinogen IX oxidase